MKAILSYIKSKMEGYEEWVDARNGAEDSVVDIVSA